MVISIVNPKGGCGKSTLSINLAYCFSCFQSKRVVIIDADPQASCVQWQSIRDNKTFDVIHHPKADLHGKIKGMTKGYKFCIVDAPPGTSDTTLSILLASNLVVVPISPSPLDLWSSNEIADLISEGQKHNKKLRARILISKGIPGTTPAKQARKAFERFKMPIFKTEIHQRVAFVKSFISGQSVLEFEPNGEAAREMTSFYNELMRGK
jgi:chromosome partitioning protein